ncbi:MAG: LacI family DNA-binding transcriptional regulator [Pseudomonadota bacterium]
MPKKGGSIRDVAKLTGLSTATISRVFNNASNVKPETRDKVLKACAELDYVPNPAARSLTTNRSKTIAAIIPTIEHSVFAKYITAIEQTLAERDYSLVLAISNSDPEEELTAANKLIGMGAEAFILSGIEHSQALIDMFQRRDVPHVFTSYWEDSDQYLTIGYDNFSLAKRAVKFLASKGHERIAVVHGLLHESDRTRARREGAAAAAGSKISLTFVETDLNVEGGKRAVKTLFDTDTKFSSILCFSDVLALGAYFSLVEANLTVPEDVSLMGFDNLEWSKDLTPPLTTIDLPAEQMGVEVATQIMSYLEESKPITSTLLAAKIINRSSVKSV